MAERDTTDADVDIAFDFFEDSPRRDQPAGEPERGPRRLRRGGGSGPGSGRPVIRLALLVAGAILLAVVLVFWVQACREDSRKGAYQDYMQDVGGVVNEANGVGEQLTALLTTPGLSLEEFEAQLDGLAQQQTQVVTRAADLTPPGSLVDAQRSLVESMGLLQSGLAGLRQAFGQIQLASDPGESGATLSAQARRLVAGEVVYEDLFQARSQLVMKEEGVTGVPVPELTFLDAPELIGESSLAELVRRVTQGDVSSSGLHGNSVEQVRVQPEDRVLSPDQDNTIVASDDLVIQVAVKNSGDFQETQVKVNLTIQQSPEPIRKSTTLDVVNAGETKVAEFRDFTNVTFAARSILKIAVRPVPGETNTANNTVEYPVIFTLE